MAAVYKTLAATAAPEKEAGERKNKQRVLILSSRGVTYRHRHLLSVLLARYSPLHANVCRHDLYSLMPHSRKEAKLDTKSKLHQLNELAEL